MPCVLRRVTIMTIRVPADNGQQQQPLVRSTLIAACLHVEIRDSGNDVCTHSVAGSDVWSREAGRRLQGNRGLRALCRAWRQSVHQLRLHSAALIALTQAPPRDSFYSAQWAINRP